MTTEELMHRKHETRSALQRLQAERDKKIRDEVFAFEQQTRKTIESEYAESIEELRKIALAAQTEYEDALIQEARGDSAKFPVGTRMVEWSQGKYYHRQTALTPTGKMGIVEVITRESQHPNNLASYSRASVGEPVIRLLKKDGTIGSTYAKLFGYRSTRWHPEGVDPNVKQETTVVL